MTVIQLIKFREESLIIIDHLYTSMYIYLRVAEKRHCRHVRISYIL